MSSKEMALKGRLPHIQEKQTAAERYGLDAMFAPSSVAVIGASDRPGTVGRTVLENLLHGGFQGKVYPINAKNPEVLGLKAYRSIRDISGAVDLAVVSLRQRPYRRSLANAVDARHKSAVVISAGFRELGAEGVALEKQIQDHLRRSSMRLIGPNCLGIMNPAIGLNATFAKDAPKPGSVAFLSQSGALLTAILDWSHREASGIQRDRFHRLDAGCRLGRFDLPLRRRPAHQEHPALHGIGGRCAVVPVGGSRSRAHQADHRDQGRPLAGGLAGCRFAHRRAHGQRRSSGRGLPPLAEFCASTISPIFSIWRKCSADSRAPRVRGLPS